MAGGRERGRGGEIMKVQKKIRGYFREARSAGPGLRNRFVLGPADGYCLGCKRTPMSRGIYWLAIKVRIDRGGNTSCLPYFSP